MLSELVGVMEHSKEGQPSKPEKSSSPARQDQHSLPAYPDWAAMQAYYGPRFAIPPYSAVASPHVPQPYMWVPPQSMIPAYGPPYAAFYAHGGFFGHSGVPIAGSAFPAESPAKLSGNINGGFVKKLKEFDGLTKSIGNGNANSGERGTDPRQTESEHTNGSSDGSNGITAGVGESRQKRSRQGSHTGNEDAKKRCCPVPVAEGCQDSTKPIDSANTSVETIENLTIVVPKEEDLSDPNTNIPIPYSSMADEAWLQNERELKRERRKQSNRESARRSRLRKQAEMEELTGKVKLLALENMTLKSEINKLVVMSEKLKLDNIALTGKVKAANVKEEQIDDADSKLKPDGTQNLLERVNKSASSNEGDSYENRNPVAKLHQLLDPSHRTDAVAAS